ncbi:hypothetical protein SDC9_114816 [bioreactor metagenome]|uniref:Uncharacterized protein n=1 Tax=bioreactor metagenome TaxID=1076179 RepID=A0A645BTE7_9ZZZZ
MVFVFHRAQLHTLEIADALDLLISRDDAEVGICRREQMISGLLIFPAYHREPLRVGQSLPRGFDVLEGKRDVIDGKRGDDVDDHRGNRDHEVHLADLHR